MPLISVDATQVNERDGSILNLGQKSLVAIELRNWITREFEAPLQSSEIMTDQCIHSLARKVAPCSRIALSGSSAEGTSDSEETDDSIRKLSVTGILTPPKSVNSSVKHVLPRLPPLPLPALEDILKISTASVTQCTGTSLYQRIQEVGPEVIADAYERQMYLERREPLPENGPFTFIHPINAPQRSQAWRAAIAPDTLHGETLTSEGRNWLFYATRLPGISVDSMKHYSPNHTVAVLWRRHVFELKSQSADQPINAQEVYAAYREIRKTTEELRELKRDC
ncbi:hypothetical protein sscle_02g021930 [Sclerotinia sclerotiorum 1980 UF-70]|uniref:Uncharacterized protein n=1 Tax=Sclerotinia sclerotiorum (strain ATCC 18683 / 1980 / Ss-1) TaxID=665079 RepID=A0A1D9PYP6_SCLS1|nr:hypothetical protein sscle_02g021930 [Sclerotinia sclerotiorum 1980 UF-70]